MKKLRRSAAVLAVAALVFCVGAVAPAQAETAADVYEQYRAETDYYCPLRGDIDCDGDVTAADARLILRCIVKLEPLDETRPFAYLVDNNTLVDAEDARTVLRIAVGLEGRPVHGSQYLFTLQDATCRTPGVTAHKCVFCGKLYDFGVIPVVPHEGEGWQTVKEATCRETGLRENRCRNCGEVIATDVIGIKPHLYGAMQFAETPDCTHAQPVYWACERCGFRKTGYRLATDHSFAWVTLTEATCNAAGTRAYKCTVCGAVEQTEEVPSLGGHLAVWTVVTPAIATAEGLRQQVCTRCGEILAEEPIPVAENGAS